MRRLVRALFGFNVFYEGVAALMSMFTPRLFISMYGANPDDHMIRALFRLMGPQALLNALICGLVAIDPDRYGLMLLIRGLLAVLILFAEVLVWATGEVSAGQVVIDMVMQVLLVVVVTVYHLQTGRRVADYSNGSGSGPGSSPSSTLPTGS